MRVHVFAQRSHYLRHLRAVWKHLPDDVRGSMLVASSTRATAATAADVVLVAGWSDVERVHTRLIYVEHGAGQAYCASPESAGSPGYHGTTLHPARVIGYVSPRQDVADSWGRPAIAAGCPVLDEVHRVEPSTGQRLACMTFHWGSSQSMCPESGTALEHWRVHLPAMAAQLRASGYEPIGHWHPRNPTMRSLWRSIGVTPVDSIDCVLTYSSLLIADNTSVMYEAATLGVPVIALNTPAYRRDVHHGLRFWSHVPGWQVDDMRAFAELDLDAYVREDWSAAERAHAVGYCYADTLGHAGRLAADWITELVCAHAA